MHISKPFSVFWVFLHFSKILKCSYCLTCVILVGPLAPGLKKHQKIWSKKKEFGEKSPTQMKEEECRVLMRVSQIYEPFFRTMKEKNFQRPQFSNKQPTIFILWSRKKLVFYRRIVSWSGYLVSNNIWETRMKRTRLRLRNEGWLTRDKGSSLRMRTIWRRSRTSSTRSGGRGWPWRSESGASRTSW